MPAGLTPAVWPARRHWPGTCPARCSRPRRVGAAGSAAAAPAAGETAELSAELGPDHLPAAAGRYCGSGSDGSSLGQNSARSRSPACARLNDLGESALASVREQDANASVILIVRSGNAELVYTATPINTPRHVSHLRRHVTGRARQAARGRHRDGSRRAGRPGQSRRVRVPAGPGCTRARTTPASWSGRRRWPGMYRGRTGSRSPRRPERRRPGRREHLYLGRPETDTSTWWSPRSSGVDYADGELPIRPRSSRARPGTKFKGSRPVRGLGTQATAIFEIARGIAQGGTVIRSGNLLIETSLTDSKSTGSVAEPGGKAGRRYRRGP